MARIAAEERQLSYHEKGRCWRKFYRGKMHYLDPRGISKSDDASYRQALRNWEQKKLAIDLEEASQNAPSTITALRLAETIKRLPTPDLESLGLDPSTIAALNVEAAMRGQPEGSLNFGPRQTTIAGLVDAYISAKRALANAGAISRQMLIEYEHNARFFGEWATQTGTIHTDSIDSGCLERYRQFILRLKNPAFAKRAETAPLGRLTIRKRLARLKSLIEWAYETEQLAMLPRNLKGLAKLRLENHEEAEKTADELFWTVEEVRELFAAATQRTKLYILLAVNCGYTQTDIATLRHAHIDWQTGVISRPRHKTKGKQVHKLWPSTLELLKAEATKPDKKQQSSGLVLLGENRLPLLYHSDTTTSKQDTIRLAFSVLLKSQIKKRLRESSPELFKLAKRASSTMSKEQLNEIKREQKRRADQIDAAIKEALANESRTFKSFRKTSANLIERQFGDGSKLADQFLGHTQKATKRFYVDSHYESLFTAIDWLGEQYGLAE
ncbi:hypothetical protein Psta_0443 [Pirellula staleyi DSM 6068]|uniref:Uncharacterized protein n=1 Tax=Pirellula staleyi (strain ATCC 27377 / DSM 6068 / ICPB 4128) TaxID=530564 RepID=D2R3A0_PIRSD|nr:tyrosine-type recombinase/integrase [Pirellula staleyi]ADB15131.1 hypothetical protein Psta_0443 [Pirellula staleyi DSM 6068]